MNDTNVQTEEPQKPDYSVFDEYAPLIYNYVGRFCHDPNEAERIFGDVFVQFLEKLSLRKRPPSDARISLYRMAYDTLARRSGASVRKFPAFINSLPSREAEAAIKGAALSAMNRELR